MGRKRSLAEAGQYLRAALQILDEGEPGSKAAVHVQWAIDLIDEQSKDRDRNPSNQE